MADPFDPDEEGISPRQRAMRLRRANTMAAMENDPGMQQAMARARASVLGTDPALSTWNRNLGTSVETRPEDRVPSAMPYVSTDAEIAAQRARPAPALNQPPIGKPMVPSEPQVRVAPRPAIRGGGGMPQRGARPDAAVPAPRQVNPLTNPLGLSPNSPFKYGKGGKVIKSESY